MVGVAQLVEHLVVAQVAVGSSPITHPIKKLRGLCQARAILFIVYNQTFVHSHPLRCSPFSPASNDRYPYVKIAKKKSW